MRSVVAVLLIGAFAAAAAPAQPRAEPPKSSTPEKPAPERSLAEAARLAEIGAGLEAELAQRVAAAPGRFDLARYDRLNRQALEGLPIAAPSLRPRLEGQRLASDAGMLSDLVVYRIEMAGTGPFSALQAYLVRLAASLGGGRAQLEDLRLAAAETGQVSFAARYAVPHFEPFEAGNPETGNLSEVVLWLEAQNGRRRLSIKLLDQLAESSRPRDLADGLAALGRAAAGRGIALSHLDSPGPSLRLEGFTRDPAVRAGLEQVFLEAGFYEVRVSFLPADGPCQPFAATMRLGRIEKTEPAADADGLFASAAKLCRSAS